MANQRPTRLPLYEHIVSPSVMERTIGVPFASLLEGSASDRDEFFRHFCGFFRSMTYDVVSFEVCVTEILPESGAIGGGRPGPIQNRSDFERYPWGELAARYREHAAPRFDTLAQAMPEGMMGVGGVGNGVFEISEDLVGIEYLPFIQADDPELYGALYTTIGELLSELWTWFVHRYADSFVACRFGDDLGFKSSLLTNPTTVRQHILPQYARVIDIVHAAGRPFLWHSCGNIFDVMEDAISLGIDAKHSNEDAIAPFDRWIDDYGDRIGLVGGFDMHFLCSADPEDVFDGVVRDGSRFREKARGYALGSGNSIPDFVPVENYLAMIRGAQEIRRREG
jgi:uroporphyrinogen decarboxylase